MQFKATKILIISIIAVGIFPFTVLAEDFSDVQDNHINFLAIQTLKNAGIISGYGDGTFMPEKLVSRAEALAIILKAKGITAEKSDAKIPFTDVPQDAWFYPMVQKGYETGKIKGYSDNTFRPNATITLSESLAMTMTFLEADTSKIETAFEGWDSPYKQYSQDKNLVDVDSLGMFPVYQDALTRARIVEIIYRMRIVIESNKPFDITKNWIAEVYSENHWKIKRPSNWQLTLKGMANSVLMTSGQPTSKFFTRLYPNNARLSISLLENAQALSSKDFFNKLKTDYATAYDSDQKKPTYKEVLVNGNPALIITSEPGAQLLHRYYDAAIYLPNKSILMFYGEYGTSAPGFSKHIETIIQTYEFTEKPVTEPKSLEQRTAELRENILVKDAWKSIASLFPDKKIISTDAIGIGTGPVDYYFTAEANLTIKLERNSGTILNVREGETSAF